MGTIILYNLALTLKTWSMSSSTICIVWTLDFLCASLGCSESYKKKLWQCLKKLVWNKKWFELATFVFVNKEGCQKTASLSTKVLLFN